MYLCRPKLSLMKAIAGWSNNSSPLITSDHLGQIRHQQSNSSAGQVVYMLLLVPRATEICRKVLEDEGVSGDVNVLEVSAGQ